MAVSENDLVVGPLVPASGVTTISLDFYFEQASWLEVYKTGSETPLTMNVDYTVAGAGSSSGAITLTAAANGTDAYSIYLVVPLERISDMQLRGEFKSEPFNIEMDRIWQAIQRNSTQLSRALQVGATSPPLPPLVYGPGEMDGRAFILSEDGTAIVPGPSSTDIADAQANAEAAAASAEAAAASAIMAGTFAENFGFGDAGNTPAENLAALQAANDSLPTGGRLVVRTSVTIEGDFYLSAGVNFDNFGSTLTINNGAFNIDGANAGAHVDYWEAKIDVIRTGSVGPAIYLGGDDTTGANKAAIRGRLYPIVRGSTGDAIKLANAYLVDVFAPSVRGAAGYGWNFQYGPTGVTSANAINIFGGETQSCGGGYTMTGVSGVFWHGHVIKGNSAECFIGENSRGVHHIGGYFELNGTSGYDVIIGDSGSSPHTVSFDSVEFYDGDGAGKTSPIKAVKLDGLSVKNCRASGYTGPIVDFQPIGGVTVKLAAGSDSAGTIGLVADGVTDDRPFLENVNAVEVAQNGLIDISRGAVFIGSNITISAGLHISGSGKITPDSGVTVSVTGQTVAGYQQCFDHSSGGNVYLRYTQDVHPEWWGTDNTALSSAFKNSASGSKIILRGVSYESIAIAVNNDPLATYGADTGKVIQGPSAAQRYKTTGDFFGARIRLADGQNTNLFTVDSGGANAYGSGGLRNVMLEGNKSNNTTGSGVKFNAVKDWEMHNVYAWDFADDGISFSGANNQINMTGFIELWNNGRDGLYGAAIGDPMWAAEIRCVNNGRWGAYIASGRGRINNLYAYFNADEGVVFETSADDMLHVGFLRVEDNGKSGARIKGKNITFGVVQASDNGVTGASGTQLAGVYLDPNCENVQIGSITSSNRTAAIHNQRNLVYDLSAGGVTIGTVNDDAFGIHGVASEQTLYVTNSADLSAVRVGGRRIEADTYANLKNAGASITMKPATYSRYVISSVTESMTINNTTASASSEAMEIEIQIESAGSYNVNWASDWQDNNGGGLAATALTTGQKLIATFRRSGGKWRLAHGIAIV